MSTTTAFSAKDEQLKAALERAARLENELEAARNELQHFVYAASHDLQEPLRAVSAYAKLLERLASDAHEAKEFGDFITSSAARMNTLLQNLVAYSRINLAPALQNVNLNSVVHATKFKLGDTLREFGVRVLFADLPKVAANEIQLCQLFEQVFLNSIRFRGKAQPLEIEVTANEDETTEGAVQVVRIKDNGAGIDPQFLTQVLAPFKRLHGKDVPGNGLGLAMAEKIMQAHQGKIWLESDGASGVTVYLAFPL